MGQRGGERELEGGSGWPTNSLLDSLLDIIHNFWHLLNSVPVLGRGGGGGGAFMAWGCSGLLAGLYHQPPMATQVCLYAWVVYNLCVNALKLSLF